MSATNPENGTVSYSHNADGTLNYRLDAKGQKVAYGHDGFKRTTAINRYPAGPGVPDVCQSVSLVYATIMTRDNGQQVLPGSGGYYPIGRLSGGQVGSGHGLPRAEAWQMEFALIAQAIWNRYQIALGEAWVQGGDGNIYTGVARYVPGQVVSY